MAKFSELYPEAKIEDQKELLQRQIDAMEDIDAVHLLFCIAMRLNLDAEEKKEQ